MKNNTINVMKTNEDNKKINFSENASFFVSQFE
jgi:hypothetical protein